MSARNIRSVVGRFVLIGGLAIALTTGFVAVDHPSHASAMPKLTCVDAWKLGQSWQAYGDWLLAYGYYIQASAAYTKADSYFGMCDGGQF